MDYLYYLRKPGRTLDIAKGTVKQRKDALPKINRLCVELGATRAKLGPSGIYKLEFPKHPGKAWLKDRDGSYKVNPKTPGAKELLACLHAPELRFPGFPEFQDLVIGPKSSFCFFMNDHDGCVNFLSFRQFGTKWVLLVPHIPKARKKDGDIQQCSGAGWKPKDKALEPITHADFLLLEAKDAKAKERKAAKAK